MSEFMIHRKILRQCGGDLQNTVKRRTTEQYSAEDIINILEEVTTRTRIGSSRVNLKTGFNTPWKDSVDKFSIANFINIEYKSADKGKSNEIDIENEPYVERDEVNEDNSDHNSSIFSEYSKDIENINSTCDIMESYSHLPQLRNDHLDLARIEDEQLMKAKPNMEKGYTAECELPALLYDHVEAFESDKEPLGAVIGHEGDIILNIERPYPPLLRRPEYPESPKSREALEIHIKELLDIGVIRKVGHNEEVGITTPVIVAWHIGKSRVVGDFRALSTYTVPDRYPIPKIPISLTQISEAVYITIMDSLERFNQNLVTPRAIKYLSITVHCGVYEFLGMPFGIKNAPSHFQRMMNGIFPEELSEGWLIIYIDDIIVCSKTWEENIYRLSRFLNKIEFVI
ncbi:hypothetical protein O181_041413 [Austropuccinia psidii MF-1]|uniref:Reverse transcriptase domain-containing protein n=1 Tax=Austropuccinia psidii MF-1 TaxID=1389203 RepID=A0A9Q3HDS3_9BASI|nr:hypothetical protein [Austropuccinia psidii MF-1]